MPEYLKTLGNLTAMNLLQDIDAKVVHLNLENQPVLLQKHCKMILLQDFQVFTGSSHNATFKMCWLEFRFQNLPLLKSTGENVPYSCVWEAYPSHFSLCSECASIV